MFLLNDCGIGFFSREDGYCMKCFKDDIIKCVYIIYAKDSETNLVFMRVVQKILLFRQHLLIYQSQNGDNLHIVDKIGYRLIIDIQNS